MTIYDTLRDDHDKHRQLLDLLIKTHGDSKGREELFSEVKSELTAHANAEEQTFYAALLASPRTQEMGRHSVHEHEQLDELLEDLGERDMSQAQWLTQAKKLKDLAEHHMREEEQEVFPQAGHVLSESQKEKMADEFSTRKQAELGN